MRSPEYNRGQEKRSPRSLAADFVKMFEVTVGPRREEAEKEGILQELNGPLQYAQISPFYRADIADKVADKVADIKIYRYFSDIDMPQTYGINLDRKDFGIFDPRKGKGIERTAIRREAERINGLLSMARPENFDNHVNIQQVISVWMDLPEENRDDLKRNLEESIESSQQRLDEW